jgi:metal-responsive CopG/Arc/MetJ family transcriptional regulator
MSQNSNELEKGIRVSPSFNSKQIALIDSLIGELGDDRSDVVRTIFLNYLSEKDISTSIIKKNLSLI